MSTKRRPHLFIRYFDSWRQLGVDIVGILPHLTSSDQGGVAFPLQPLHMLGVDFLAIVHTGFQIGVELRQLLLNVPHSLEWHVKFC